MSSTASSKVQKTFVPYINDYVDVIVDDQLDMEFEDLDDIVDASRSLLTLCVTFIASKILRARDSPSASIDELVTLMDANLPDELLLLIAREFLKRENTRTEEENCFKVSRVTSLSLSLIGVSLSTTCIHPPC